MKTTNEIKNEMRTTRDEISENENKIKSARKEIRGAVFNPDSRSKLHGIREEIARLESINAGLRLKNAILSDNLKLAFKSEKLNDVIKIWNKYAGKKYGEKTRDKIYNEIKAATGCGVYLIKDTFQEFCINELDENGYTGRLEIRIYTKIIDGVKTEFVNAADNVIQAINADGVTMYGERAYVNDEDARVNEIQSEYNKLLELNKQYGDAVTRFNSILPANIKSIEDPRALYSSLNV